MSPRPRAKLFTVQVWVSDQWLTLEGAACLPREEAHTAHAQEAVIAGRQRVRIIPVTKEPAPCP